MSQINYPSPFVALGLLYPHKARIAKSGIFPEGIVRPNDFANSHI